MYSMQKLAESFDMKRILFGVISSTALLFIPVYSSYMFTESWPVMDGLLFTASVFTAVLYFFSAVYAPWICKVSEIPPEESE